MVSSVDDDDRAVERRIRARLTSGRLTLRWCDLWPTRQRHFRASIAASGTARRNKAARYVDHRTVSRRGPQTMSGRERWQRRRGARLRDHDAHRQRPRLLTQGWHDPPGCLKTVLLVEEHKLASVVPPREVLDRCPRNCLACTRVRDVIYYGAAPSTIATGADHFHIPIVKPSSARACVLGEAVE